VGPATAADDNRMTSATEGAPHPSATRLPLRTKLAFGIGQGGEGIMARSLEMFLLFFYSQVLGLSATFVGLVGFIALIIDAVLDLVIGSISDNWQSSIGRRHPFMYAAVLPFGISFIMLFSPPDDLSREALVVWFVVALMMARIALALYHVPHMAQGAELSDDEVDRAQLAGSRVAFGISAGFIVNILAFGWFFRSTPEFANGQMNPAAYPPFALFFGILLMLTIFISAAGTHRDIPRMHESSGIPSRSGLTPILRSIGKVLRLRSYSTMLTIMVTYFVAGGVFNGSQLYLYTYLWAFRPNEIMLVSCALPIGLLIGFLFIARLNRALEKRIIFAIGIATMACSQVGPLLLRLLGVAPENGTTGVLLLVGASNALVGIAFILCVSVGASLMAEVADELEHRTSTRQEGVVFGGFSVAQTAATGLGGLILGLIIDHVAFPRMAKPGTVDPATLESLGWWIAIVVIGLSLVSMLIALTLELSRERQRQILDELRARRGERLRAAG
jgi:glycoside/pentoside/hexuronide:cation symporter, GPH family